MQFSSTTRRLFQRTLGLGLLVSFPLSLAAGCSIDDRDLEVHDGEAGDSNRGGSSAGGSSSRGGTGGGSSDPLCEIQENDDGCISCDKTHCCEYYAACLKSAECTGFVLCGAGCGDDQDCFVDCANEYPDGYEEFLDWTACSDNNGCLDAC